MAFLNPLVGLLVVFFVYKAKDCHMRQRPLAARYAHIAIVVTMFGILLSVVTVYYIVFITNVSSDTRHVSTSPRSPLADITFSVVSHPTDTKPSDGNDNIGDFRVASKDDIEQIFNNATMIVHKNKRTGELIYFLKPTRN